jgi:hypothetical protein
MDEKRKPLSDHTREALQSELQYLRDVYSATRSEIRNDEQKIVNNLNYTVASAGVMIAASTFIVQSKLYLLFLALPFLFFVLAFLNLEHNLGIAREGNFLRSVIYPRIREIIELLDNGSHDFGVNTVDWENFWVEHNLPFMLTIPLSASMFGLHLLFGVLPIVFFFYYSLSIPRSLSGIEILLLVTDLVGYVSLIAYLIGFRIWSARIRSRKR